MQCTTSEDKPVALAKKILPILQQTFTCADKRFRNKVQHWPLACARLPLQGGENHIEEPHRHRSAGWLASRSEAIVGLAARLPEDFQKAQAPAQLDENCPLVDCCVTIVLLLSGFSMCCSPACACDRLLSPGQGCIGGGVGVIGSDFPIAVVCAEGGERFFWPKFSCENEDTPNKAEHW